MRTATGGHRPSTANPLSTRVLSLIMAFILMFGILPIPAAAADIRRWELHQARLLLFPTAGNKLHHP